MSSVTSLSSSTVVPLPRAAPRAAAPVAAASRSVTARFTMQSPSPGTPTAPSIAKAAFLKASAPPSGTTSTPAPTISGDVNGDGVFNSSDAKALMKHLFGGQASSPAGLGNADINGDGAVDVADVVHMTSMLNQSTASEPEAESAFAAAPSTISGDIDSNGQVDGADVEALMHHLFTGGEAPAGIANADVNGDGEVNVADVAQLTSMANVDTPESTTREPSVAAVFGDVNGDGVFDRRDADSLTKYLFGGESNGNAPSGLAGADLNADGSIDISDVVQMMNMLGGQGPYAGESGETKPAAMSQRLAMLSPK